MARAFDLAVTAWSPLAAGLLTGKHAGGASGRAAGRTTDARTDAVIAEVVGIAEEVGTQPAQIALAWLLRRAIPILGATKEQQMTQNLGCLDVDLERDHLDRLDRVSAVDLGFPHEFLRRDAIRRSVYGARHADVVARPASTVAHRLATGPAAAKR
jgi:aryl-alcohol dehydrogenase-like predicted oxidoreductase